VEAPAARPDTKTVRPPSAGPGGTYTPPGTRLTPPAAAPPPREAARPWRASPLVWRIFASAAAVVCLLLATVVGTIDVFARRSADAALARGLDDAGHHVESLLDLRTRALASGAMVFAQRPGFRSLVLSGTAAADLLDQAQEAKENVGATWVQITDDGGVRLAKSDEPAAPRVSLGETALVGGALGGSVTAGAGVAGDTVAIEGVAVPITVGADSDVRVVGTLVAARALNDTVARELRDAAEGETLIYLLDGAGRPRVSASTIPAEQRARVLDLVRQRRAAHDSAPRLTIRLGGSSYVGRETPLRSAGGEAVGGVITLRSVDKELAPFLALRRRVLLAGLVGLLLTFGVAYAVGRQVTRPILALRDAARRVAAGDLSASQMTVGSSGEVAELADAVRSALGQMQQRSVLAELVERARATAPNESSGARDVMAPPTLKPGDTLTRRYVIDAVLGVGGYGVVYRATDGALSEPVAIKMLRPEALLGGTEALERLKDEIRLARRIAHSGVVRIHDLGEADGTYFVTMEYVPGLSLDAVLRRVKRLTPAQVIALGKQLCGALGAAHAQGVIHRDIKPQNLVIQPDGALKVLDFGVARLAERSSGLTATGLVVGTPAYMAPEQLLGEPMDARVDIYSTGVVLYEALTGRRPFDAPNPAVLIGRILNETAVPPSAQDPAVPGPLSDAIMTALARDTDARPARAETLVELLDRAARMSSKG